jgi:uncharacterized protein
MDQSPTLPWYRHRWPWLLMLGPAVVVVAGFYTSFLAMNTDDGLVADDYYKQGLGINRVLEREERARALALVALVSIDAEGRARVTIRSPSTEIAAAPPALRLTLVHPTRSGRDRSIELWRDAEGSYAGQIDDLAVGRWRVGVETAQWRIPSIEVNGAIQSVRLDAAGEGG